MLGHAVTYDRNSTKSVSSDLRKYKYHGPGLFGSIFPSIQSDVRPELLGPPLSGYCISHARDASLDNLQYSNFSGAEGNP